MKPVSGDPEIRGVGSPGVDEGLRMFDRDCILTILRGMMPELRSRFGVASLAVFGSCARGEVGPRSDLDVLVSFQPGAKVTLLTLAALSLRLEEAIGVRVDVVEDHPRLRPEFRAAIDRDLLRVA